MRWADRGARTRGARRIATIALAATVAATVVGVQGASSAPTARAFRFVRLPNGHLAVEHATAHVSRLSVSAASAGWELDAPVQAQADPDEPQQWGLGAGDFPTAWPVTTGAPVIVAVVDSGVRRTHVDLNGAVLPGTDFVSPGGDGSNDQNGHGTHVAGIIGALRNGVGVVGAAPSVKILPVRVLNANGAGFTSDVAAGIVWAADHGARVINLSLGGPTPSSAMQQAMQYANSKGAVVVVAAGNNAQAGNPVMYPAAYPEALSVAAVDSSLNHAPFSETGSYVDLAAPGVNVLSTWGSSDTAYAYASGTSMATPFVSAATALVIASAPKYTVAQVTARLESTARDLGTPGRDSVYGYGLVDAGRAVVRPNGAEGNGYWVVGANGRVRAYGGARFYGDLRGSWLLSPTVAAAATVTGGGYWLATADGHVVPFGDARFYGDMGGHGLDGSIVAMARTPSGRGYWLMGRDGGVFSFGDARFFGSTGGMHLTAPALDLAPVPNGQGYWFVASDGGVFCFGSARFHGSTGGLHLWQPVVSMAASRTGAGYWLVASDGGIFTFGVPFRGSLASQSVGATTGVRIRGVPSGAGYYVLTADGIVHAFGTAHDFGSASNALGAPAVDLMLAP